MGHAPVPAKSRADASVHGFWNWVNSALFDMQIVNLDAGSYLCQTSEKAPATEEKEKNNNYLQPCLERSRSFTPMVYSTDGINGTEAIVSQQRLASMLSNKLKRD